MPRMELETRIISPDKKWVITERRVLGSVPNEKGMYELPGANILISDLRENKGNTRGSNMVIDVDITLPDGSILVVDGKQVTVSTKGRGELNVSHNRTLKIDMDTSENPEKDVVYTARMVGEGESLRESQVRIVRTADAKRETRNREREKAEEKWRWESERERKSRYGIPVWSERNHV